MKKLLTLLALGLTLGLGNAYAADDGGCAAKAAEMDLPLLGKVVFSGGVLFFPISYIFGDILTEVSTPPI